MGISGYLKGAGDLIVPELCEVAYGGICHIGSGNMCIPTTSVLGWLSLSGR